MMKGLEDALHQVRDRKHAAIQRVFYGQDATEQDLIAWAKGQDIVAEESVTNVIHMNSRTYLGLLFDRLKDAGSIQFCEVMCQSDYRNALFLAKHYNYQWSGTYSANIGRLTRELILGLERRKGISLEKILDAGCGPLVVSRLLKRPTTNVDLLRHQLEYGLDATDEVGIHGNVCYLGDMSNLKRLVPFDQKNVVVFHPREEYAQSEQVEDQSQDLVVASLSVDLLNQEGRFLFLQEAHRVLRDNKFLILILHTKSIHETCREQFVRDVESCGYLNLDYFTGIYSARHVVEVETAQDINGRKQNIDAFALVAQKKESVENQYHSAILRLQPEFDVIDGKTRSGEKVRRKRMKFPYSVADHFVKRENNLSLLDILPEERRGAGEGQKEKDVEEDLVRRLVEGTDKEVLRRVLDEISSIITSRED